MARRKTKLDHEVLDDTVTDIEPDTEMEQELTRAQQTLKAAMNADHEAVIVIGKMPNGKLDIRASHPQFDVTHWLLNRAVVELVLMENNQIMQSQKDGM